MPKSTFQAAAFGRWLLLLEAWALLGTAAALVALNRFPGLPLSHSWLVLLAALIPGGLPAAAVVVLLFLAAGRGWGRSPAMLTLLMLMVHGKWALEYLPTGGRHDSAVTADLRVLTLHARCDAGAKDDLPRVLLDTAPDILTLQGPGERLREYLGASGALVAYTYWRSFPLPELPSCATSSIRSTPCAMSLGARDNSPRSWSWWRMAHYGCCPWMCPGRNMGWRHGPRRSGG